LLERHGLTQAIFAEANAYHSDMGIMLRSADTLIDAIVIHTPCLD